MPTQRSDLHGPAYPPARVFKPGMEFEWVGRKQTKQWQHPAPRQAVLVDGLGRGQAAVDRLGEGVVLTSRWLGDYENRGSIDHTGSWALVGGQRVLDSGGRALVTEAPSKIKMTEIEEQAVCHLTAVRDELGVRDIVRTSDLELDDDRWDVVLRSKQDEVRLGQLVEARTATLQRFLDIEEELSQVRARTSRVETPHDPSLLGLATILAAHRIWSEGPNGYETGTFCTCGDSWAGEAFAAAAQHQAAALIRA